MRPEGLEPVLPRESAQASLQYIRRTLEAAGRLSSVSGAGMIAVGALALVAVGANMRFTGTPWSQPQPFRALAVWAALLAFSGGITSAGMAAKARRAGEPFWTAVLRKAIATGSAPLLLGGILSLALLRTQALVLLPVAWLGCYGAALVSAGAFSVSPVRYLGISFLALSAAAAWLPATAGLPLLALGFGGLHIVFGSYIYWRHDG